jgi:hypothetical protein
MPSGVFTQISQSTGDQNSSSQVFTQNTLGYYNSLSYGNFFSYLYPVYRIEGASLNYYDVDYNSISYDITNGKIYSLFFSGESISSVSGHTGSTLITHSLYRLPFSSYSAIISSSISGLTNEIDLTGTTTGTATGNTETTFDIQSFFDTPLVSITENVSGITIINDTYTYSFPTLYKDVGNFTQPIFEDKGQYVLDTVFSFEQSNDITLGDAYVLNPDNSFIPERVYLDPSATTFYSSNLGPVEITGDTPFSGTVINGAFFTYFVPPKKPNLYVSGGRQLIAVEGTQTNLSPVFNFANVDDGDYYLLQVNYDILDTPFSGTDIYTYTINKQAGDAEFVRVFSTPLRANDDFNYRIGNTKEITNIFGIKQSITNWSDSIYANIVAAGQFYFSGYTWRNFISTNYDGFYNISGMTIGASTPGPITFTFTTVANATMPLNTISAATDGINTIDVEYNGTLYTQDWRNAVYSATNWSNLGLYVVNDSPFTAVTDSSFSFTTQSRAMANVSLSLTQIYNNTQLDLSIDLRSSENIAITNTENYVGTNSGLILNRVSSTDGYFNFGLINGGYYRLTATPPSPQYAAYQPIDIYMTINSNLTMDLIFYIIWGNQSFTFDDLSNETFL